MYKKDLALNDRQVLICHKTQPKYDVAVQTIGHFVAEFPPRNEYKEIAIIGIKSNNPDWKRSKGNLKSNIFRSYFSDAGIIGERKTFGSTYQALSRLQNLSQS